MEGNVRTRTVRAWTEPEIAKMISDAFRKRQIA